MDPPHCVGSPTELRTQGGSENNLKFICEFRPDEGISVDSDYESVTVILPAQCTISQLRLRIYMKVHSLLWLIFETFNEILYYSYLWNFSNT